MLYNKSQDLIKQFKLDMGRNNFFSLSGERFQFDVKILVPILLGFVDMSLLLPSIVYNHFVFFCFPPATFAFVISSICLSKLDFLEFRKSCYSWGCIPNSKFLDWIEPNLSPRLTIHIEQDDYFQNQHHYLCEVATKYNVGYNFHICIQIWITDI